MSHNRLSSQTSSVLVFHLSLNTVCVMSRFFNNPIAVCTNSSYHCLPKLLINQILNPRIFWRDFLECGPIGCIRNHRKSHSFINCSECAYIPRKVPGPNNRFFGFKVPVSYVWYSGYPFNIYNWSWLDIFWLVTFNKLTPLSSYHLKWR